MAYQTAQRNPRSLTLPKKLSTFWVCDGGRNLTRRTAPFWGLPRFEADFKMLPVRHWSCISSSGCVYEPLDKNKTANKKLTLFVFLFFNNSPRQWPPEATRFLFLDFFLLCGRCQTLTWRIEESVAWSLKKRERSWLEKVWEKKEINTHKLNASLWLTFCPSTPSIVSCVLCSSISTVTIGLQDLSGRMRRMPSRRITVSKKNSRLVIP